MTTEREFEEWAKKIRRVRGQASAPKSRRQRKNSPVILIILFICGLAIATAITNHLRQQAAKPDIQLKPLKEYQL